MAQKSFLTRKAQDELITWLAANGENYRLYCDLAEKRGWKVFSAAYFRRWIQRHRLRIQGQRAVVQAEAREMTVLSKATRIEKLEAAVDRLEQALDDDELTVEQAIKVEEQLRKTLESIAKERGEFNNTGTEKGDAAGDLLGKIIAKSLGVLPDTSALPAPRGAVIDVSPVPVEVGEWTD